jgi:hypothetical protein
MSTDYQPKAEILIEELMDSCLERFGVHEVFVQGKTSTDYRCLTDGHNNYLWVYGNQVVECLTRFLPGGYPGNILGAIAEAFDTEIFSEYQPQYWGYETEEEWDAAMREMHEESQAEFYIEIMKHVRGEPHNIDPKTNGMTMANIAKDLIATNPNLASPGCEEELMENVDRIWTADHCTTITLDEKDIAIVRLAMTDVEGLPGA